MTDQTRTEVDGATVLRDLLAASERQAHTRAEKFEADLRQAREDIATYRKALAVLEKDRAAALADGKRLRAILAWCRPRLRVDQYRTALDRHLTDPLFDKRDDGLRIAPRSPKGDAA